MKLDFEEMKKAWETPFNFNGDYAKTVRKNMLDGITKVSDYHTQMVRGSVDTMNRMHDMWLQGVEWYIDSHKKMTSYVTERLSKEQTTPTNS